MAILFGKNQINRPTPAGLANAVQIFTGVAGAIIGWLGTSASSFIPVKESGIIQSLLGLGITIAIVIKPFFGVKTDATNIPISEVTAMEEPKKP